VKKTPFGNVIIGKFGEQPVILPPSGEKAGLNRKKVSA
jgi:hypothetical protein